MPQNIKYPQLTATREDEYNQAVEDLYESMEGKGYNENELVRITSKFNAFERMRIAELYAVKYSKSLEATFKAEIKGDALKFYITLYASYYINWATWIYECVDGKKDNVKDLSRLIFMMTQDDFE